MSTQSSLSRSAGIAAERPCENARRQGGEIVEIHMRCWRCSAVVSLTTTTDLSGELHCSSCRNRLGTLQGLTGKMARPL